MGICAFGLGAVESFTRFYFLDQRPAFQYKFGTNGEHASLLSGVSYAQSFVLPTVSGEFGSESLFLAVADFHRQIAG